MTHLRDLLLGLGRGFSFVGSQVPLTVDGQTFYLDLLLGSLLHWSKIARQDDERFLGRSKRMTEVRLT